MLPGPPLSSDRLKGTMGITSIRPPPAAASRKAACPLAITKGNVLLLAASIPLINTCLRDGASIQTRAGLYHLGWSLEEAFRPKRQAPGIPDIGCIRYHPERPRILTPIDLSPSPQLPDLRCTHSHNMSINNRRRTSLARPPIRSSILQEPLRRGAWYPKDMRIDPCQ